MIRYQVAWAITARDDLEAIAEYIADDNPIAALKFVERLESRAASLKTAPLRGRIVPELRWHGVMSLRELIEKPWRIIYRIEGQEVHVISVLDGRRSLEDLLLDRFVR